MADQGWQEDIELKDDLQKYVESNLQRKEILDFVKEKYPLYAWSLQTFCRRLKHFGISYIDYNTNLDHVEEAVREEIWKWMVLADCWVTVLCTKKYGKYMALRFHGI
jgi:hypothetical protein